MKYFFFCIFFATCNFSYAAFMTVTATHVFNGSDGTIEIAIDEQFSYPPFSIKIEGPNGYTQTISNTSNFIHIFSGLKSGIYSISVTNSIGCTATESIEIIECSLFTGGELPAIILCSSIYRPDAGDPFFYITSPSNIKLFEEDGNLELRLLTTASLLSETKESALAKSIQVAYDIKINGSTIFDVPSQSDITDQSMNMIIKFNSSGEILWVYHKYSNSSNLINSEIGERKKDDDIFHKNEVSGIQCTIFPNPFVTSFEAIILTASDITLDLCLFNLAGQPIEKRSVSCRKEEPNRQYFSPNLPVGTYLLMLNNSNKHNVAVKVIRIGSE